MEKPTQSLQEFVTARNGLATDQLLREANAAGFRKRGGAKLDIGSIYGAKSRAGIGHRKAKPAKESPSRAALVPVITPAPPAATSRLPALAVEILRDSSLGDSEKVVMLRAYAGIA